MLDMRTIPVTHQLSPELQAYADAMREGFFEAPISEAGREVWHRTIQADGTRLRGVYDTERPFGLAERPVGTFASFAGTINTGTTLAPTTCITDVTVAASHRRRGIMQQMITADLAEARDRGDVFAALTATDTRLYGRFGFGVTADARRIEIDTRHGFGLHREPTGRCVFADADAVADLRRELFETWHTRQFWSLSRHAHYWASGFDWAAQTPRPDRAAVHFDDDGNPDAAAIIVVRDDHLELRDLLGLNHVAELELIRFIALLETHDKVVWSTCHDSRHPLAWAVADRRSVSVTKERDTVWARIIDVTRALEARSFESDGDATLRVVDPIDDQTGTYSIRVTDGRAEVTRGDGEADVTMPLESLAPIYSAMQGPVELSSAGRATGTPKALANLARLFAREEPGISASIF